MMNSSEMVMCDSDQRPRSLHVSKSFSPTVSLNPNDNPRLYRASSLQNSTNNFSTEECQEWEADTFERKSFDDELKRDLENSGQLSDDFDKLPIELVSLGDHFIESLSAKVHPSPPSIEKLSSLFQDFYEVAVNHINTHISILSSRQSRQRLVDPSFSSIGSTASKLKSKTTSIDSLNWSKLNLEKECQVQQMLTTEEIADRRESRKLLEAKRIALEEAVERKVCEATYDKIWRHRSTHDEERDEKLRSRTATLSLVGIGPRDLGVDLGVRDDEDPNIIQKRENEVVEWLAEARKELCAMNDLRYPMGKLQHLKTAHKAIVKTLSHFHPSSSADEVMPMLIYTLITSRPEGINIMSNLHFIQRFRHGKKIDGEAAYCLTNLEAAISFLETVDLASLRADEELCGPPKNSSRVNTPSPEIFDPLINPLTPSTSVSVPESSCDSLSPKKSKEQSLSTKAHMDLQAQGRRFNDLLQSSASLSIASDVVLSSADQGLESIGNSIGDSYKFLLGKFKRKNEDESESKNEIISKTVENISKESVNNINDDSSSVTTCLSQVQVDSQRTRADSSFRIEDRILSMIGGRKSSRDKSIDSSTRVSLTEETDNGKSQWPSHNLPSSNPALVESMRNLGNTLNPMSRIAGIRMIRAFGRSTTPTPSQIPPPDSSDRDTLEAGVKNLASAFPDLTPTPPSRDFVKVAPPIIKFLELQSAGEMRLNEVKELLRDYKRLANLLKELGVF